MLISGTIQSVTPPDYSNNFGVQYQNIVINTANGPITGRIGKKQPYTMQNIGHQDQWDMEQAQGPQGPYNKLKKHYDTPYQGGQQNAPQGPPQAGGGPDVRGMHIIRGNALNAVFSAAEIPLDMVSDYLTAGVHFIFTGKWDLRPPAMGGSATPNPAMGGDNQMAPTPENPEDDIGF